MMTASDTRRMPTGGLTERGRKRKKPGEKPQARERGGVDVDGDDEKE